MSKTYRNIKYAPWVRRPRYKWKLLAGMREGSKGKLKAVTDWDDNSVAAVKEMKPQGIVPNYMLWRRVYTT